MKNTSFKEISPQEIIDILNLTIKEDRENKLVTFLAMLTAYTESEQLNISFNAPSSTGKSYIPNEVSKFFPKKDVVMLAHASPMAFFHESGEKQSDKSIKIDLSRKILIFLDQPHQDLLQKLRALLSHDQKELIFKITGKSKGNHATKTMKVIGYPVVVFCSAGMRIDEQESTRFILLSPETTQEKLKEALMGKIRNMENPYLFEEIDNHPARQELMARIMAIKAEKIERVIIKNTEKLETLFIHNKKKLLPRHQRDIGKVGSLIKAFALLNLWHRERNGEVLYTNEQDLEYALDLWNRLNEGQELGISPYIYQFYKNVILEGISPEGEITGLSRKDIAEIHLAKYGRPLGDYALRMEILPSLKNAGLIEERKSSEKGRDGREWIVYPTLPTI